MTDYVYRVVVEYSSHDLLKEGVTVAGYQFCAVLAKNGREAELIAAQMVACRRLPNTKVDCMVTGTRLLD